MPPAAFVLAINVDPAPVLSSDKVTGPVDTTPNPLDPGVKYMPPVAAPLLKYIPDDPAVSSVTNKPPVPAFKTISVAPVLLPIVIVLANASAPILIAPVPVVTLNGPLAIVLTTPAVPVVTVIPPPEALAVKLIALTVARPAFTVTPPAVETTSTDVAAVPCCARIRIVSELPPLVSSVIAAATLSVVVTWNTPVELKLIPPVNVARPVTPSVPPIVVLPVTARVELKVTAPVTPSVPLAVILVKLPPPALVVHVAAPATTLVST